MNTKPDKIKPDKTKTYKITKNTSCNKSKKSRNNNTPIYGKVIEEKAGWKKLELWGEPYEIGFAHGYLLKDELKKVPKLMKFLIHDDGVKIREYMHVSNTKIKPVIKEKFPEIYEELKGISAGALKGGLHISVDVLIAWNSIMSLSDYFANKPSKKDKKDKNDKNDRCSAFIATGSATKDGKIVMAHNTHSDIASGYMFNIVLKIKPCSGYEFTMQTSPGYVASVSDWFICSTGIIGCETTIYGTNYPIKFGSPFFCRIRKAMQYGTSLDQYTEIMMDDNAGDYACSWLLGNINTNEIMLYELTKDLHNIKRTKDGVFYGMNSAIDPLIRAEETDDIYFEDMNDSSGSRNYRLNYLLNTKYYGKLDIHNAKRIISDHYDMKYEKINMGSRCVCSHTYLTKDTIKRNSYFPHAATDGKVTNTSLARKQEFVGRFGSSCGEYEFKTKDFVKEHPVYKKWEQVIEDVPIYPWVKL